MMKDEDKQTEEIKNGIFETFHENGQLASRENYKDGELDGPWEWFYENGQLMTRATFINGKKEGLLESFHSNGQLQMTENYKDNELDGLVEEFEENGELSIRENYKDGVLQDENDEQTDDTATETTDAAPKGKMVKLQKVKLSETQLTLWEVEFTVDKSYDKKTILLKRQENILSL